MITTPTTAITARFDMKEITLYCSRAGREVMAVTMQGRV
jgi:hypothetical protein